MKRILTLSFIALCLLLSAVLLASCGPTKGPSEHEHVWDEGKVVKEGTCDPATKEETKGEKLYTCTICGETKTEETDGHVWGKGETLTQPTCSAEGQTIYFCTRCGKGKTEPIPKSDTHVYRAGDKGRIVTPPTADKPGELEKVCTACGKGIIVDEVTLGDYNRQVRTLRNEINQFTNADFNANSVVKTRQEMISLSGRTFNLPPVTPKTQHPRVLFNASNVKAIAAELYDSRSKAAQLEFLKYVNNPTTGKLRAAETRDDGFHNFDADVLNRIQALALDYQLTGNEISGYSAVRAMLNFLKTMDFQTITGDYERQNGFVMYTAACVYDWCHDLMNDVDRQRMVAGVQHKCCEGKTNPQGSDRLEIGFPPSGQHSIAGHGCEFQLLRDYLSFAIAIYDEYPGWWEYIAGRIYQEFVPTRNEYYKAGMYPQGVSVYIRIRFTSDLFSAWLLKAATGRMPYDEEGMKQVARTYYCYELPDKEGFASGDNSAPVDDFIVGGRATLISSYLFNDATMRAQLEYFGTSYSSFTTSFTFSASVTEYLICSSGGTKAASDRHEDLPLIQYNGGWLGQIIARNSWNADQATVLMKIGERTMANHDHADAGSFQIYYKTTLAGDTGSYDTYDAAGNKFPHFKYYHQATIAHNSLLIFNPSKAGSSSNDEKYYSGGQKQPGETGNTTTVLQTDAFKTGTVTGRAWGYADAAQKTPTYAYIAGDITPAYYEKGGSSSNTVNEVARRMLTVYDTGNADVPMFFFVWDFENIVNPTPTIARNGENELGLTMVISSDWPSMAFSEITQAVAVVPRFAPMIRLAACFRPMIPEFTRPTERTVIADEDWTMAVSPAPNRNPMNALLVILPSTRSSRPPVIEDREPLSVFMPNRNSARPPSIDATTMKISTELILSPWLCYDGLPASFSRVFRLERVHLEGKISFLQLLAPTAVEQEQLAVRGFAVIGAPFGDMVHVQRYAAVDGQEAFIQLRLDLSEQHPDGIDGAVLCEDVGLVVAGLHADDVPLVQLIHIVADAHRQRALRRGGKILLRGASKGFDDVRLGIGLDQVMDGIDAEGIHRVAVGHGGERHGGVRQDAAHPPNDLHAVFSRQVDIHEDQVIGALARCSEERLAGLKAVDDAALDQPGQHVTERVHVLSFIVADGDFHVCPSCLSVDAGSSSRSRRATTTNRSSPRQVVSVSSPSPGCTSTSAVCRAWRRRVSI